MTAFDAVAGTEPSAPALLAAAIETQDALLIVGDDLDRLQRLLDDSSASLVGNFTTAAATVARLVDDAPPAAGEALAGVARQLNESVSMLQVHDLATQLVDHVRRRLRHCADRLAADAMGDDALVAEPPTRPNPVRQEGMDAGSVELF